MRKRGGLAEVAESLPKALAPIDDGNGIVHDVRVAIPRYKQIKEADYLVDFPEVSAELMREDAQFVVVGSGAPYYEKMFKSLGDAFPQQVKVTIGFNPTMAQRIYAGSDMFLMPAELAPGALTVNVLAVIAYRLGGVSTMLVATDALILPSFLIILL